jgi:hypothetical protein
MDSQSYFWVSLIFISDKNVKSYIRLADCHLTSFTWLISIEVSGFQGAFSWLPRGCFFA